ncbi:MAG: low temperature requirement protein A [Gammaproteobacteria bacterium]|nr:low temperature requirement protein A [Gammaproteobacteria bacterium]
MTDIPLKRPLLRASKSHEDSKVVFVELFFDLVFVFAVTQLSHSLLHHFSLTGMAETAFLMLAVWWVWIYTTWVTNWLDPQTTPVRLMLFLLMFAGLILSTSIPQAFGSSGLAFACAYVFMQIGRSVFMCWALSGYHMGNYRNFLRITAWLGLSGLFWISGGFAVEEARYVLWGIALFIETVSPAVGFWTPRLGRSTTADWDVSGAHMAERCGLFIIIALGESLLVTGATFAELPGTLVNLTAFFVAFASSIALWWIYFNIGAEHASIRISESDDPGRIARLAYTYLHIPIVAGLILVAVSDELILAHPGGHTEPLVAIAIVGGPLLFLLGNLLFKQAVFGKFALSHVCGALGLIAAFPAHEHLSPLALAAIAAALLFAVGVWENISVKSQK